MIAITKDSLRLFLAGERTKMTTISEHDEGKTVLNQNGDTIGMVSSVQGDRMFVNPEPGITDKIKTKLGWEGVSEDDYVVREKDIDEVTDDAIRLNR